MRYKCITTYSCSIRRCNVFNTRVFKRNISYILGIETSCDDTGAAIVDSNGNILSQVLSSQWELNAKWHGIVPALAARAHSENLPHILKAVMQESGLPDPSYLSAIAVTTGPGLAPCLGVGVSTAKELALEYQLPFIRINHLEAHVLVSRLPSLMQEPIEFPFVVLLISGGHTCLVLAKDIGDYDLLGSTVDDSVGEAFDKVARMLSLHEMYPETTLHGGKLIEEMANLGDSTKHIFTEPMLKRKYDCDFSYSGLKTAMIREINTLPQPLNTQDKQNLCASFQETACKQLVRRTQRALNWSKRDYGDKIKQLVVCGGVASNFYLRNSMKCMALTENVSIHFPPVQYCTDNGVMVAWAGMERFKLGIRDDIESTRYSPRWPIETLSNKSSIT